MARPDITVFSARGVHAGRGKPASPNRFLVVADQTIEAIAPTLPEQFSKAPVVDLGDCVLIPGLIDSHVHITMPADGRSYDEIHAQGDEDLALMAVQNLTTHLRAGFTTVRDNGGRNGVTFAVRAACGADRIAGPTVLAAGRPLTPSSGHFNFCGGAADGPVAIRAEVQRLAAEGADHIKVVASGGGSAGSRPVDPTYTVKELCAAVETAHELQLLVTAHCRSLDSMRSAVEAGVDCIEHADFLDRPDPSRLPRSLESARTAWQVHYDERLVETMWDKGIYLGYTLQAGGYERLIELDAVPSQDLRPSDQLELVGLRRYFECKLDVLGRLLGDGYRDRLALSSDAGPGRTAFGRLDLWLELAGKCGMSAMDALDACTSVAARLCGIESNYGALDPGKRADFLAIAAQSHSDIPDLADVRAVFVSGRLASASLATAARISASGGAVHPMFVQQ